MELHTLAEMTQEEANAMAKEVFGDQGYVYDRDRTPRSGAYRNFPRFYVGSGAYHYGNGSTWEEAFKNVKRFREQDEL